MMRPERAFVDKTLLLRFLTIDVPDQAEAVERLLRRAMLGEMELVSGRVGTH